MAVSTALLFSIISVFLLVLPSFAAQFNSSSLLHTYDLVVGRSTACPRNVTITDISADGRFVLAKAMSADGQKCTGLGGKAVQDGSVLLPQGLRLPPLVTSSDAIFFAGVETAPRTCGKWAFNASAVSWFLYKSRGQTVWRDRASGLEIEPGFVYVTYEHFADFCAFRAPTPEAVEGPSEGRRRECFPASATVQLQGGRVKRMDELRVGDRVLSSTKGEFSDVYFFSHHDRHVSAVFVRLEMASKRSLSLTNGHFIYLNGVIKPAHVARVGDLVTLEKGATERIVDVRQVKGAGLYNPHTRIGDIVVDGVLTTTWTTAVPPTIAEALLAPIRLHYELQPGWIRDLMGGWFLWFLRILRESSGPNSIREL